MAKLQVLISTFGEEGIRRVVESRHPSVEGVEYIVSWQLPDVDAQVPEELVRDDFKIYKTSTRGLSKNRNNAFTHSDGEILLISDDDVVYDAEGLIKVRDKFRDNPEIDLIAFEYTSKNCDKRYPAIGFIFGNAPKNYFTSSIEIAMRRSVIAELRFNEHFGIGSGLFGSGEEDIFIYDVLKAGFKGMFIPEVICRHDGLTTAEKIGHTPKFIQTKGAVHYHVNSFSWPLRMIVHAYRESRNPEGMGPGSFIKNWIIGAWTAFRIGVFRKR